jgi:hypothetical protein
MGDVGFRGTKHLKVLAAKVAGFRGWQHAQASYQSGFNATFEVDIEGFSKG